MRKLGKNLVFFYRKIDFAQTLSDCPKTSKFWRVYTLMTQNQKFRTKNRVFPWPLSDTGVKPVSRRIAGYLKEVKFWALIFQHKMLKLLPKRPKTNPSTWYHIDCRPRHSNMVKHSDFQNFFTWIKFWLKKVIFYKFNVHFRLRIH